mmetsp:Transcript_5920/g.15058  ORF Transcript_5920/g.15058 Transcript_5920/m.15058 type:complete len:548 (-) Transcript_5920:63-1706(-)|eukprot:CAMPEP_0195062726 /NCGR_PEP_ID=MMETSP0448-20130528/9270_1 /TAXON_ID=66468 /ORGANISM="Heterocapsa triquestra, Strain CCMP 448" /LENGTH=547 /DNA_ID=CAMNT_0040093467 /DNA_START=126 /DNA_END=1769 /DNA_ORIENTATION=+
MGGSASKKNGLDDVVKRAEGRSGKITVSGRYHRLPKRLADDYIVETKVLGTGYNGSVFKARSKIGAGTYAVKGFHLNGITGEKMKELETEAEIFLSMDHPHVARLVDVYECENRLNLVMECMEGGELFERVRKQRRFTEVDAGSAIRQMLLSINYIHSKGIVHRDLKLENFLYETKESDHLKLIDFGFSHIWEPNTKMKLSCGTLAYVAPEVLNKSYTSQCDLWSLGVITFIMLSGYMPFYGSEEHQIECIKSGKWANKPEKWAKVSDPAKDFMQSLMVVSPSKRLTAEQALNHPFIHDRQMSKQQSSELIDADIVEALQGFAKASQFRRACMSVMAWSLTSEERAKVRDAFIAMDESRQGTITLGELKKVLTEKFTFSDEQVQPIFEALDTGENDQIHYTEFLAAMVSTRIAMHDDLLRATFQRFDVDNSGSITVDNLRVVLGDSFDGEEVENLIKEADFAGDGKISYDEFIRYLKEGDAEGNAMSAAERIIDHEVRKSAEGEHKPGMKRRSLDQKNDRDIEQAQPRSRGADRGGGGGGSQACAIL